MGELIGYARCSTVLQDLTAQRQALAALGVPDDRIYLDKGLTGTSRARPGLDQAQICQLWKGTAWARAQAVAVGVPAAASAKFVVDLGVRRL